MSILDHVAAKNVLTTLASGQFLCETVNPKGFAWLRTAMGVQEAVTSWLKPIGLRLAKTSGEGAFYAVLRNETGKDHAALIEQEMSHLHLDRLAKAIEIVIRANGGNSGSNAGDRILKDQLPPLFRADADAYEQAVSLGAAKTGQTHDKAAQTLLGFLVKNELAHLTDPQTGEHRITGKIEWVMDMLDTYNVLNDEDEQDAQAGDDAQGSLL